jgi:hypothetical protein
MLALDPKSPDALALSKYTLENVTRQMGDFSAVLKCILLKRMAPIDSKLTIRDVNEKLDVLSRLNSQDEKAKIIMFFYTNCSAKEQYWISKIILK